MSSPASSANDCSPSSGEPKSSEAGAKAAQQTAAPYSSSPSSQTMGHSSPLPRRQYITYRSVQMIDVSAVPSPIPVDILEIAGHSSSPTASSPTRSLSSQTLGRSSPISSCLSHSLDQSSQTLGRSSPTSSDPSHSQHQSSQTLGRSSPTADRQSPTVQSSLPTTHSPSRYEPTADVITTNADRPYQGGSTTTMSLTDEAVVEKKERSRRDN